MGAGGRWVGTFARAQYLFAEEEYRGWDAADSHANQYNQSVFDECVRPVVAAGQARIITPPFAVSGSLMIEPAPGHTAGHAPLRLRLPGRRACLTRAPFARPAQNERPPLLYRACELPRRAVGAR